MRIVLYTKAACPLCDQVKALLRQHDLQWDECSVDAPEALAVLRTLHPEVRQMPACFVAGQYVGGLAGLRAALAQLEGKAR